MTCLVRGLAAAAATVSLGRPALGREVVAGDAATWPVATEHLGWPSHGSGQTVLAWMSTEAGPLPGGGHGAASVLPLLGAKSDDPSQVQPLGSPVPLPPRAIPSFFWHRVLLAPRQTLALSLETGDEGFFSGEGRTAAPLP